MKSRFSLIACIIIALALVNYRISGIKDAEHKPFQVTTWDALGYYIYLPSVFIYHDFKKLDWLPAIDAKYSLSGGKLYQAQKDKQGNYIFKYLAGVAILESPFFLAAHALAGPLGYPADGFSAPYQYFIAFGAILYCILALFLLRKILLRFFSDAATAITLILLVLATNIVQYISFDSAMSHSYIFPLYVLILYFTIKWHEKPSALWASLIGATIGLASVSRPTEAIMLFIPLLWGTQDKEASAAKWKLVRQNWAHLAWLAAFGFLGAVSQIIYWKAASGSFIYDVGSKWEFLTPHIRVLFGWENGWFIYTPVTIFFIAGMFFIRKYPFKYSIITFCLLNIYIIIAWHDWRYGATYSCRALTQSYPVFALAFAAFIERVLKTKWKFMVLVAGTWLIFVNLFQIWQYNRTILHFRDMNRKYYCGIFLDPSPTPLDMSLLDTDERLYHEEKFKKENIAEADSAIVVDLPEYGKKDIININLMQGNNPENWLKISARINILSQSYWGSYINCEISKGLSAKQNKIRIDNALSRIGRTNEYEFFVKVPPEFAGGHMRLFISASCPLKIELTELAVDYLSNK
jgi:hypothetical protein